MAERRTGRKGRAPQASGHFVEPIACLAVADVPIDPNDVVREALAARLEQCVEGSP